MPETTKRRASRRAVGAGGVGIVVPFVAWAAGSLLFGSPVVDRICPSGGLECTLPAGYLGIAVAAAVSWPLLLLARVRPAWPVVLLGPLLTFAAVAGVLSLQPSRRLALLLVVATSAISYAVVAYLLAKLPRRRDA